VPTPKKEQTVISLRDELGSSQGVVVLAFTGLSVPALTELRRDLGRSDARLTVVKNRLLKLALAGSPAEGLNELLTGQNAVMFCHQDVPAAVKVLTEFAKDHEGIEFKGSCMEDAVYDGAQTAALGRIPSRPELLGQIVGALNSPITGLVYTLRAVISDFVYTLQAVADQKADQPAS
jgi:large subunit ribosomal protein L10